jgi:hypothetical protein
MAFSLHLHFAPMPATAGRSHVDGWRLAIAASNRKPRGS